MHKQQAIGLMLAASVFILSPAAARAQARGSVYLDPYRPGGPYASPGNYGMAYGSMSAGVPRTYTKFTSPYGLGYSYGYAPPSFLPGPYGLGLWRAGVASPGYPFGAYLLPDVRRPLPARRRPCPPCRSAIMRRVRPPFTPLVQAADMGW